MTVPAGVKLPPQSNPLIVAYERLTNSNARTPELQREREELRLRFGELELDCGEHFARCDEVRIQQLLEERIEVSKEAKAILAQKTELQKESGQRTGGQSLYQQKIDTAVQKQREFVSLNRTISSLEAIAKNETEQIELEKAVNRRKREAAENQQAILQIGQSLEELTARYKELANREEAITEQIEELKLPPDQRRRPSSIVWQGPGDEVFTAQLPLPNRA